VDVYPTIAALAAVPVEHSIRGRDLLDPERDEKAAPTPIFSETSRGQLQLMSMVLGRYKLIHNISHKKSYLFDMYADLGEQNNLAPELPDVVESMKKVLDRWRLTNTPQTGSDSEVEIDAAERERLQALGYLQDDE
jgi:arylsulfatase A-like enzyme